MHREIYEQIKHFQGLEKNDPKKDCEQKEKFLQNFKWENSVLTSEQKVEIEEVLVEFSDIFAKHRFDVDYKTELKIKLIPEHDMPVYVQSPITPIPLRDELIVELVLMHYFNLVTTLSHSKYSSPVFAQRKSSGKFRILIDLRRINHLLRNDYINTNFPISNMSDASNHFAGKTLFTKLDCSQAYHWVQMADDLSFQFLAFNFASRTYAYKCLTQGLSKSVTGFSAFIRHYLDPCLASNVCTQYMDVIGSGVEKFEDLIPSFTKIFECVRKTDNKSLTQFFHSKGIPPSLWNFLDRLLSFNLVIAHILSRAYYAADFLSRVQTDPSQRIQLKLTDRIPVKKIEIETVAKSPDVSLSCLETFESLFSSNSSQKGQNVISELKKKKF